MLLLASSAFHTATADPDLLDVEKLAIPPAAQDESKAEPASASEEQGGEDPDGEERRRIYAQIPEFKRPSRFGLEERQHFRPWLHSLCVQEAVAVTESKRMRFRHGKKEVDLMKPNNKQGSFKLLLENYISDVEINGKCSGVKKMEDESACLVHYSRFPHHDWASFANWMLLDQAENAKQSGKAAWKSASEARLKMIKAEFKELREASALDGKPESAKKAREILKALKEDSSCSTRSVEVTGTTTRQLYQAQK